MREYLVILAFLLLSVSSAVGATVELDAGADIQQVIDSASGDLEIILAPGTYSGFGIRRDATWGNPDLVSVFISVKNGGTAIIEARDGADAAIAVDGGSLGVSVVLEDLVVQGNGARYGIKAGGKGSTLTVRRTTVTGITGVGIAAEGLNRFEFAGSADVPAVVRAIAKGDAGNAAVTISNCAAVLLADVRIENNTGEKFSGLDVRGATQLEMRSCRLTGNSGGGAFIGGVAGSTTITDCRFSGNGGNGFSGSNLGQAVLANVTAVGNGENGVQIGDSDGLYSGAYTALSWQGGAIQDNQGTGVVLRTRGGDARLLSLTISGNGPASLAGGLYASVTGGMLLLRGLTVTDNQSSDRGGGVTLANWRDAVLRDLLIRNNSAAYEGGGLYVAAGSSLGLPNRRPDDPLGPALGLAGDNGSFVIAGNTAGRRGGGMFLTLSPNAVVGINGVLFQDNVVPADSSSANGYGGGGLYLGFAGSGADPRPPVGLANCTFDGNRGDYGAALYLADGCFVSMSGCRITNNGPPTDPAPNATDGSAIYSRLPGRIEAVLTGNSSTYDVYFARRSSGPTPYLDLRHSWWGTADMAAIEARIRDHADNQNFGWVLVQPPLAAEPGTADRAPFPYVDCAGEELASPVVGTEAKGAIRGRVVDQADATTRIGIPGAVVSLYLEGIGERRPVASTLTDANGYYLFEGLDVNAAIRAVYPPPLDRLHHRAAYTVTVRSASLSNKALFNDSEREGYTYYRDQERRHVGVTAGEVTEVNFVLEPELGKTNKLWLVDVLSRLAPINYAPAEGKIALYLDTLSDTAMSDAQEEGLKRAVTAERGLLAGYVFAQDTVGHVLEALGGFIASLLDDLGGSDSELEKRLARLERSGLSSGTKQKLKEIIVRNQAAQAYFLKLSHRAIDEAGALLGDELDEETVSVIQGVIKDVVEAMCTREAPGATGETIQALVTIVAERYRDVLLDGDVVSYAKTTAPLITGVIEPQLRNWSIADEPGFLRDRQRATRLLRRLAAADAEQVSANNSALAYAEVAAQGQKDGKLVSLACTAVGAAPASTAAKVWEKGMQVSKYGLLLRALYGSIKTLFSDLPDLVHDVVYTAFGLGTGRTPSSQPRSRTAAVASRIPASTDTSAWTAALDQALDQLEQARRAALQELDARGTLTPEALLSDQNGGILPASERVLAEVDRLATLASASRGHDLHQPFTDMLAAAGNLAGKKLQLTLAATDLWLYAAEQPASTTNPIFLGMRRGVRQLLVALAETAAQIKERAAALAVAVQGAELTPVILVHQAKVVTGQDEARITRTAEQVALSVSVTNIGSLPVHDLGVRLACGPQAAISALSPQAAQQVGSGDLAPGGTAQVTWRFTYQGDGAEEALLCVVRPLEGSGPPRTFTAPMLPVRIPVAVLPADGDGIPVWYERRCGLDPQRDDAAEDKDGDGLANLVEWRLGTRADLADTDSDGIDDGAEVRAARRAFTHPLLADTDGDGIVDGEDGAPLDATSGTRAEGAPEPATAARPATRQVVLSRRAPAVTVSVAAGDGESGRWAAVSLGEGLLTLTPEAGEGDGTLQISTPEGFNYAFAGSLLTRVLLVDLSGPLVAPEAIEVVIQGDDRLAPGDLDASGRVDLADGLLAVRLAAGLGQHTLPLYPMPAEAALTQDGIGVDDAMLILRQLAQE